MQLSEAIPRLASALNLPALVATAEGACAFAVQGVSVSLIPRGDAGAFICRAHLGALGRGRLDSQLEPLLAANLFAMGVGGAVIGVDAQARVFLTQHFQEDGLEFAVLLRWLERFVQRAVACRASLAAPSQAGAT